MAQLSILAGATSQSILVFIQDSTSTVGLGLGAVAPAGGSLLTGTTAYYSFTGTNATATSISLSVLAAVGSAWSSGAMVTLDDTHMKGWVRFDLPNAVLAASKGRVVSINIYGGTNMAQTPVLIELTGWDNQNANSGGLAVLPASAVPGAAGGLFIAGTNAATVITTSLTTHFVGTVDTLTTYTGNTPQTGDAYARLGAPAGASIAADLAEIEGETDTLLAGVIVTTNNDKTGYTLTVTPPTAAAIATAVWQDSTAGDFTTASSIGKSLYNAFTSNSSVFTTASLANAPTGGSAPTAAQIATAVWQDATSGSDFTTTGSVGKLLVTTGLTVSAVTGSVGSVTGSVGSVVGAVGSVAAAVNVNLAQNLNSARALDAVADTNLTLNDAYHCAIGVEAGKWAIVGTTWTMQTPSTGTTLRSFTLDSATAPTKRT